MLGHFDIFSTEKTSYSAFCFKKIFLYPKSWCLQFNQRCKFKQQFILRIF